MPKRILINSHSYAPDVGGSETACEMLVEGFCSRGLEVVVVTMSEGPDTSDTPHLRIVRKPSNTETLRLIRWADIVIHSNISLRTAWLLLFCLRPWFVIHHTVLNPQSLAAIAKQCAALLANNIAVSQSLARGLLARSVVLGNCYRDDVFYLNPEVVRDRHLIVVGRLVSTKGVDLALEGLARLHKIDPTWQLTIVGDGPERRRLEARAELLEVTSAVRFTGVLPPAAVAKELNRHRVLLVPSIGTETFGLVVLEAIACGCVPVVTNVGGLPESVGPCGVIVPENSVKELAGAALELVRDSNLRRAKLQGAEEHLARFRRDVIVEAYIKTMRSALELCSAALSALSPLAYTIAC